MLIFKKFIKKIILFFKSPYFGFTHGHTNITSREIDRLKKLVGKKDSLYQKRFEDLFALNIGTGSCVSYGSARMGFYELMKYKNIKKGDEIIILGATCSVMINAILRLKAIPKFSDIDLNTYGSEVKSINKLVNKNTKIIIAQHSFGIPCDIDPIVEFAKKKKIFLIEDCALTLGSSIKGKKVGNFGDAAIFSTDHTKPINTITGGLVYSKNRKIINYLKVKEKKIPNLSYDKQQSLWIRFLYERKFYKPKHYGKLPILNKLYNLISRLLNICEPFLGDDYYSFPGKNYPYPCKIPAFLAAIGIIELKRWPKVKKEREENFKKLVKLFNAYNLEIQVKLKNKDHQIVGLRFAGVKNSSNLKKVNFEKYIDCQNYWFKEPIIATTESLDKFMYESGMSPKTELIGPNMFNIPCNLNKKEFSLMYKKLSKTLKKEFYRKI